MKNIFKNLYDLNQKRTRPEDVAETILKNCSLNLSLKERQILNKAAKNSLNNLTWYYSSMSNEFFRADSNIFKSAQKASNILNVGNTLSEKDAREPEKVIAFIEKASIAIHKQFGNFKKLNKKERNELGLYKNARWYNKRFRLLCRLEKKLNKLYLNEKKYLLSRVSKAGLSHKITYELFSKDLVTACFITYLSARMNRRSVFTNQSQDRPYDEIADMLFNLCEKNPNTNWKAIAYIMPDQKVLKHLSEEEKGEILGEYFTVMQTAAQLLKDIWNNGFDLSSMVVARGNDSSTWNQTAGAWNKARESWISLIYSLGLQEALENMFPGKVMRLMAADVAYWHMLSGGSVHPDTKVWEELPKPWEVFLERKECKKDTIIKICKKHSVSPQSWVGPKENRQVVDYKPTPELVNGVAISNPFLAYYLKQARVFSGKKIRLDKLQDLL